MSKSISRKNKYSHLKDTELLNYYSKTHNQVYLAALFTRFSHLIFLISLKYLKDKDEASDLSMDIYEKLVELLKYQKIDNFKSWLYSVTKNECLMKIRKQKMLNKKAEIFKLDFMESDEFLHHNDETLFEKEVNVKNEIEKLNEEQRACILKFYYENKSYKEISEELIFPEKKVKSYIQNGKRNLKNSLLKNMAFR